jgi:PhnB protein
MELTTHLSFNGQCEAAFKHYETCLNGKITFMITYGESPMAGETPPGFHQKIMHATLTIGAQRLTGGDAPPERYRKPEGFSVTLNLDNPAEADRIFQNLATDGQVLMPIQETFWALRFAMFVDRFGTPWMINCRKPAA